jgi:amino acid transporter
MFETLFFVLFNLILLLAGIRLMKRRNLVIQFSGGRWWLTWLSIALITFIIELSSIFFAPAEILRSIGPNIFFFILISYLFYHYLSTRFVEISEVMEINGIKDGGVYGFSYFVLGPNLSFIIAASLFVTYILTACISSVSIFGNNYPLLSGIQDYRLFFMIGLIWLITFLNILGIKILPKILFIIFLAFALIILNLIAFSVITLDAGNLPDIGNFLSQPLVNLWKFDLFYGFGFIIYGLSICSLSFNGMETVISNFKYVKSWKIIGKSYSFLYVVGLFIPVLLWFLLSHKIDFNGHFNNLIPFAFGHLGGPVVEIVIGVFAGLVLLLVINYSFVAFNDLLENISRKYNFSWFLKTNKHSSLFRINLLNAISCTVILFSFNANQSHLSELLALAILTNLSIIMGSLMIYRYFQGTEQITLFNTSRFGTLLIFLILFSCLIYISIDKIVLSLIWIIIIAAIFVIVSKIASRYPTEVETRRKSDNPMDLIFHLSELQTNSVNVYFIRAKENFTVPDDQNSIYLSFFPLSEKIPAKAAQNHFRFPIIGPKLLSNIIAILELIEYEIPDLRMKIHFGWPLSSWLDRLSIGVMIFAIMKIPKEYPNHEFIIEYSKST